MNVKEPVTALHPQFSSEGGNLNSVGRGAGPPGEGGTLLAIDGAPVWTATRHTNGICLARGRAVLLHRT